MAEKLKITKPKGGSSTGAAALNKQFAAAPRTEKPIENMSGELMKIEDTIQTQCALMAQLPDSHHIGVGGKPLPTDKQQQVQDELNAARKRSEEVLSGLTSSEKENLPGVLGKIEETIQKLSSLLAGLPQSNHIGIGGKHVPTFAGLVIGGELDCAAQRAAQIKQILG